MFKKLLASSSILFFAFFLVTTSVFASTAEPLTKDQQEALQIIEKANNQIDALIEAAVTAADSLQAKYLAESQTIDPSKLADYTEKYNETLNDLITKLFNETLDISNKAIAKAAALGVPAECSWVLVKIADQYVWIDPIAVTM